MRSRNPRSSLPRRAASAAALACAMAAALGMAAGILTGGASAGRPSAAARQSLPALVAHRLPMTIARGLAASAPLTTSTTTPSTTPTISATVSATPSPTAGTPDATPGLPNLVPVSGELRYQGKGNLSGCVSPSGPPGGTLLCVANNGETAAGPFDLAADNAPGTPLATAGGLPAGETLCLLIALPFGLGVIVDPAEAVAESSEDDNWLRPLIMVPTFEPGPTCVPTPAPGPGTPTAVPGPAAELAGYGWSLMEYPWGCMTPGDLPRRNAKLAITNDGNADAPAFRVAQQGDGTTVWDIPDLPAGAMRSRTDVPQSFQPLSIDPDDAVREQDETNNAIYLPVPTLVPTCTPGPTPTAFPRPDVVVERAEVRAMGFGESCAIPPIRVQVHVRVANRGTGFAEGVTVEADGYRPGWSIRRLRPGETTDLQPVDPPVSWVRARPLAYDDPSNNSRRVPQVTLTPPPICTPESPTPTSTVATETPTPTSTRTPSPTPGPAGRALLPWADSGGPRE